MTFTYRIVRCYEELATERLKAQDGSKSDAALVKRCFDGFRDLLGGGPPNAGIRRQVKRLILEDIAPALPAFTDRTLRQFVQFAIDYIRSRIIDVPHVLYIPWPAARATELMQWGRAWKTFADGSGKSLTVFAKDSGDRVLADIHPLAQLYVMGHGAPGSMSLSMSGEALAASGLSQNERATLVKQKLAPLTFDMLASQLGFSAGLPTTFAGSIKIYACSGGADGAGSTGALAAKPLENSGFVKLFAVQMRSKGYKDCDLVGYEEDLAAPTMFEMLGQRSVAASDAQKDLVVLQNKVQAMEMMLAGQIDAQSLAQVYATLMKSNMQALNLKRASEVAKRF